MARQAAVGRVVTGTAGIGSVRAVRLRAVAMTAPKDATATGRAKVRAEGQKWHKPDRGDRAEGGPGKGRPGKGRVAFKQGFKQVGRSGRVATEPTETDRVLLAVRRGDVGTTTARPSEVRAGRIKGRSGTSRSEAPAPRAVRPRRASGPSPA